jgi:hypothetical protein
LLCRFVRILNKWYPPVSLLLRYHPSIPDSFCSGFFFFDCMISQVYCLWNFDLESIICICTLICFFYGIFVFKSCNLVWKLACLLPAIFGWY